MAKKFLLRPLAGVAGLLLRRYLRKSLLEKLAAGTVGRKSGGKGRSRALRLLMLLLGERLGDRRGKHGGRF